MSARRLRPWHMHRPSSTGQRGFTPCHWVSHAYWQDPCWNYGTKWHPSSPLLMKWCWRGQFCLGNNRRRTLWQSSTPPRSSPSPRFHWSLLWHNWTIQGKRTLTSCDYPKIPATPAGPSKSTAHSWHHPLRVPLWVGARWEGITEVAVSASFQAHRRHAKECQAADQERPDSDSPLSTLPCQEMSNCHQDLRWCLFREIPSGSIPSTMATMSEMRSSMTVWWARPTSTPSPIQWEGWPCTVPRWPHSFPPP